MEKTNLNFRHGPRKFLTLPLLFMLVGLGISPQKAWADVVYCLNNVGASELKCYFYNPEGSKWDNAPTMTLCGTKDTYDVYSVEIEGTAANCIFRFKIGDDWKQTVDLTIQAGQLWTKTGEDSSNPKKYTGSWSAYSPVVPCPNCKTITK